MKLSIIVPVYKVEEFMHECIESILRQQFSDFELILVDDGSPDRCGDICEEYAHKDKRIRVVHQSNQGLSAARNTGLDIAQGEYIAFIDSDDFIAPEFFSVAMHIFEKEPETDMVIMPVIIYYNSPEKNTYCPPVHHPIKGKDEIFATWINHNGFLHSYSWNKICRRHLYDNVRFPEGALFEDVYTTPRLINLCQTMRFATSDSNSIYNQAYFYRQRNSSITTNTGYKGHKDALTHHIQLFNQVCQSSLISKQVKNRYYLHLTNFLITTMRCKEALEGKENYTFTQTCMNHIQSFPFTFKELWKEDFSFRTKIKNLSLVLFGLHLHCFLYTGKWTNNQ